MATMYVRKSRLSARQQSKQIEHFVAVSTTHAAAEVIGVQPNTANRFFMRLRQLIASKLPNYQLHGEVEADSIVYTVHFGAYNALDVSDFHLRRINHSERFVDKQNHINGIENFWNQAKRRMRKFNDIKSDNFYWYLKECEWRFTGVITQTC